MNIPAVRAHSQNTGVKTEPLPLNSHHVRLPFGTHMMRTCPTSLPPSSNSVTRYLWVYLLSSMGWK